MSVSFVNNHQPINPDDFEDEPQRAAIHLAPSNTANGINNNSNSNNGRSEPAPQTTTTSVTRVTNMNIHQHTSTEPLQIHGGNRRMEVQLISIRIKYNIINNL